VEFQEGLIGRGLTSHFLLPSVVTALEQDFFEVVRGMDGRNTEQIHDRIHKAINSRWSTGVVSMALSSLDMALWDAMGKASGRTVAELLGGARDWAPVYITFGFPIYDLDQLVEAAKLHVAKGHHRLKMVVGAKQSGWREDARRVRAVREAIGPEIELMVDANQMYQPTEAFLFARAVEDLAISWFEEPLTANSITQLRELRSRIKIPIAAGQNEGSRQRLYALVSGGAVDILQPHALYAGGYTEVRKVAHMAQCADVIIANGGGWPHFNMHVMAGLMNGWMVEYHLGHAFIGDLILNEPAVAEGDIIRIPRQAGLGIRDDLSKIAKYQGKV